MRDRKIEHIIHSWKYEGWGGWRERERMQRDNLREEETKRWRERERRQKDREKRKQRDGEKDRKRASGDR